MIGGRSHGSILNGHKPRVYGGPSLGSLVIELGP